MPVPGTPIDVRIPVGFAFNVKRSGPSLNDLLNDWIPLSVTLNPAMVLSKLRADLSLDM